MIKAKDQSGGKYNSYRDFMASCQQTKTLSLGYALRLSLFTAINPWHCAIYNNLPWSRSENSQVYEQNFLDTK